MPKTMSNNGSTTMRRRRTRSTSSAPRMPIVEVESPRVAVSEARLPSHTSQTGKPMSSTKDGTKGRGDFMPLMKLIALAVVLFFSFTLLNAATGAIGKVVSLRPSSMSLAQNVRRQAWDVPGMGSMRGAAAAVAFGQTVVMWGGTMICSNNMTSKLIERLGKPCGPSVTSGLLNNLNSTTSEIDYVAHAALSILPYSNHFQLASIPLNEQSATVLHTDFDQTLKFRVTDAIDNHAEDLNRAGTETYQVCSATDQIVTALVTNLIVLEHKLLNKASLGIFGTVFARADTEKFLILLVDDIDDQILRLIQLIIGCLQTVERADQSGQAYKSTLDSIQKLMDNSIITQQKKQGFFWWKSDTEELRRQQDIKNLLSQVYYYNTTDIHDRLEYTKMSLERHHVNLSGWRASIKQTYLRPYVPVESVLAIVRAVIHKLSVFQEKLNHAWTTEYQIYIERQRDNRLSTLPAGPD